MTTTATNPASCASPGAGFVVLADDLTSAAEAAGHLADAGRAATVLLDATDPTDVMSDDTCLCVDLNSRSLAPSAAAELHERVVRRLIDQAHRGAAPAGVYKTMDSSLRGNWAAELAAVMRACDRRVAVVAPACPTYGRRTVGGHQLVDGIPVHLGPAGRDPVRPVKDSSVLTPLTAAGVATIHVAPDPEELAAAVSQARAAHSSTTGPALRALVVDAESDDDLARAAAAVRDHLEDIVLCGSPGLWEALVPVHRQPRTPVPTGANGHCLVLVGSLHPTTRTQLSHLSKAGIPVLTTTDLTHQDNPAGHLAHLLHTHPVVAVATPEDRADAGPGAAARHLHELAALGAACARALPGLGLVLSGGDTAREIAVALGAPAIHAVGTVAAGISLGRLTGPRPHPVISKAGGFGDPHTLLAAAAAFTRSTS